MKKQTKNTVDFRKLYAFGKKLPIDLSLSENPLGCSPRVFSALKLKPKDINHYPDVNSTQLKKAIAEKFNLSVSSIFVANGSEAIIKLLPQALVSPSDQVIIPKTTFPMFEKAALLNGNKIVFSKMKGNFEIDLKDIKRKVTNKTKLIFLCNPNNPTGRILPRKELLDLLRSVESFIVVDEANIEFGGSSLIRDTKKFKNLIILRTFSKGFGLAGLRIGFCVASPKIIRMIEKISQPFPTCIISQKAAVIALADDDFLDKTKKFLRKERLFLTRELEKRGFKVVPSQTNNILVKANNLNRPISFSEVLSKKGASVVGGESFRGLGNNFIRISPRLRKTNRQFLVVIDKFNGF